MNAGDKAALVKAAQKAYDSLRAGFMAADVLSMSGISLEKLVQALLSGGGFNSHKFVDLEISDKLLPLCNNERWDILQPKLQTLPLSPLTPLERRADSWAWAQRRSFLLLSCRPMRLTWIPEKRFSGFLAQNVAMDSLLRLAEIWFCLASYKLI